jgi:hypothetical protein
MRSTLQRLALLLVLLAGSVLVGLVPAQAASSQIGGTASLGDLDSGPCTAAPMAYRDFPPLVLQGSLTGCWYTDVLTDTITPSGMYLETGRELFVGSLNGGPAGTFATTYRFEGKFAADGSEVHGRCQHPLVSGSGTGGLAGATGRIDFKDIIATPVIYVYRGHISLP